MHLDLPDTLAPVARGCSGQISDEGGSVSPRIVTRVGKCQALSAFSSGLIFRGVLPRNAQPRVTAPSSFVLRLRILDGLRFSSTSGRAQGEQHENSQRQHRQNPPCVQKKRCKDAAIANFAVSFREFRLKQFIVHRQRTHDHRGSHAVARGAAPADKRAKR